MILPKKQLSLNESFFGFGGFLLQQLSEPMTIDELWEYYKEEYIKRNALLQEQIAKTTSALEEAKTSAPKAIDYAEKIKRFNDCINALKDPDVSAPEKNTLLKNCVKRIDYYNEGESKPGVGRYVENVFELNMLLNM